MSAFSSDQTIVFNHHPCFFFHLSHYGHKTMIEKDNKANEINVDNMDIANGNNANKDGYDMHSMNETGGVGNANENGKELPNIDVDVKSGVDTQLLADDPNINNDEDDAEESSGGSSSSETADMSGESNRVSSGGYSGDYSSISDSSSDRRKEKKTRNVPRNDDRHRKHHSKGHSHTERRRSSGGVEDSVEKMDDKFPRSKDEAGIHSYHRHSNHHHHTSRGKVQPTQDMNKQIDQIMNLYNVR